MIYIYFLSMAIIVTWNVLNKSNPEYNVLNYNYFTQV